jgi:hypothetical protein
MDGTAAPAPHYHPPPPPRPHLPVIIILMGKGGRWGGRGWGECLLIFIGFALDQTRLALSVSLHMLALLCKGEKIFLKFELHKNYGGKIIDEGK